MSYHRAGAQRFLQGLGFPGEYVSGQECPEGQEFSEAEGTCVETGGVIAVLYTTDGPFCPAGKILQPYTMTCTDIPGVAILGEKKKQSKNAPEGPQNVEYPGGGDIPECGQNAQYVDGEGCTCDEGTEPDAEGSTDCWPDGVAPAQPQPQPQKKQPGGGAQPSRGTPAKPWTAPAKEAPPKSNNAMIAMIAVGVGGAALLGVAAIWSWKK